MPATPLNQATRYSALSGLQIVYVPTVADVNNPLRSEINAGTDLTGEVMEWEGFTTTSETIETPDLTSFVAKIPGRVTAEDSSLTVYADADEDDVRDILPRGTRGFLLWMDQGDTPGKKMDVYPIEVTSLTKVRSMEDATVLRVDVSMTQVPVNDVEIPAETSN